jgi:hypothetical protein
MLTQFSWRTKVERWNILAHNSKAKVTGRRLYAQEKVTQDMEFYDTFQNHRIQRESSVSTSSQRSDVFKISCDFRVKSTLVTRLVFLCRCSNERGSITSRVMKSSHTYCPLLLWLRTAEIFEI